MRLKIKDRPDWLAGRPGGAHARGEILAYLASMSSHEQLVFDFADMSGISMSFADEVFGGLIEDVGITKLKQMTSFANTNVFIASVIRSAINNRISKIQDFHPIG